MILIAGHGLAGTLLAHALLAKGLPVTVFDPGGPNATTTASGVLNPVTGKRLTRAWNLETFLPAALRSYRALEEELRTPLLKKLSALWLHATPEDAALFAQRADTDPELFDAAVNAAPYESFFHLREAPGRIHPVFRIDITAMLRGLRENLKRRSALIGESLDLSQLEVRGDGLRYGSLPASHLILCEGATAVNNPYFQNLPWSPAAGEALILSISGLLRDAVYKLGHGLSLSPWPSALQDTGDIRNTVKSDSKEAWWLGSNYLWDTLTPAPTAAFRQHCESQLKVWLKVPYEILEHRAGVRPATVDRKPFIGFHPAQPRIGIFNGLGAKGVLMAPYLAENLARHVAEGAPLMPEADVARHHRALLR